MTYRASLGTRGELRRMAAEAETATIDRVRPWRRTVQPCRLAAHVVVAQWVRSPHPLRPRPRAPYASSPPTTRAAAAAVAARLVEDLLDAVCDSRPFVRRRASLPSTSAAIQHPIPEAPLPPLPPPAGSALLATTPMELYSGLVKGEVAPLGEAVEAIGANGQRLSSVKRRNLNAAEVPVGAVGSVMDEGGKHEDHEMLPEEPVPPALTPRTNGLLSRPGSGRGEDAHPNNNASAS